jgi:hypothetical protein
MNSLPITAGDAFAHQDANKTSFLLGTDVRDLANLRLRKFKFKTGNLPAPVLDSNRPINTISNAPVIAPGTPFKLPSLISGSATGTVAIAEYTRQVSDGDHFLLTGVNLDKATYPVYQGGNFYATTVTYQDAEKASVRLPAVGAAWDAALAWASTASGISEPILLNTARIKWAQKAWAPGLEINIFGENLAHGNVEGGAGYVAIRPVNSTVDVAIYPATAVNPYRAVFTVPTSLAAGQFEYWYHNGHGGDYGWSAKRTVDVLAAQDHVLSHDFSVHEVVLTTTDLSTTDATLNTSLINQAYTTLDSYPQRGGTIITPAGRWPINGTIVPKDNVYWHCATADLGEMTTLVATGSWQNIVPNNRGMFGSHYWFMGKLYGIEFLNPDNIKLGDAEALVVLNNQRQVWLKGVRARWSAPYSESDDSEGAVKVANSVQPLRLASSENVFLDDLLLTGSGTYLGFNTQVFVKNYTHRATHNADYMVYGLNMREWSIVDGDFRDLVLGSKNGIDRGIRTIKQGGQEGKNERCHFENHVGTELGIVRAADDQNPAPDENQFEQYLNEANIAIFVDQVRGATPNTITVAKPLKSVQGASSNFNFVDPNAHLVKIVKGRGIGQTRGIVSSTVNTITVDEPWRVIPDATSVLETGRFSRDTTFYDIRFTGKKDNAVDPRYNHSSLINLFGGCSGFLIDKCSGSYFRQGISIVATQHERDKVDQSSFNVVRNCQFPDSRWGQRIEALPRVARQGEPEYVFPYIGLLANLFSNNTFKRAIVSKLVYQLPRTNIGPVPNIALLVQERQAVVAGLNDTSPNFVDDPKYAPMPVLSSTLTGLVSVNKPTPVLPLSKALLTADEIGALEPLPTDAAIDAKGVLSYSGTDRAILVYFDGQQETPLARTSPDYFKRD